MALVDVSIRSMAVREYAPEGQDASTGAWVPERGAYTLQVGRSSRDIRLKAKLVLR